jgi:hypothetical protein
MLLYFVRRPYTAALAAAFPISLPDPYQLFGIAGRITRNVNRLIVQVQYRVRYIGITQLGLTALSSLLLRFLQARGPGRIQSRHCAHQPANATTWRLRQICDLTGQIRDH